MIANSWFLISLISTLRCPVTYLAWWHTRVLSARHSGVMAVSLSGPIYLECKDTPNVSDNLISDREVVLCNAHLRSS